MKNLLGEIVPTTAEEILAHAPKRPWGKNAVMLAFSGGNDSRTLAHVVKPWFEKSPYSLELAAIDTGLSMDGWKQSIKDFAKWIDLSVSFWTGEGTAYYKQYVEEHGFPGNAMHSQIQNRLKGRAFRKMYNARREREGNRSSTVWMLSGLRKFESRKRQLLKSPYSQRESLLFINPLFYWENHQVVDYMIEHDIPFAPGKQWDCKCGATAKDPDAEWVEIKKQAPKLAAFLCSLRNPQPWNWGKFDSAAHAVQSQIEAGQTSFADAGAIESFPVCSTCWRDEAADDERLMAEW